MEKYSNDQVLLDALFLRPYTPDDDTNNAIINFNTRKRKREEKQDYEMDFVCEAYQDDVEGVTTLMKNYRIITYVTQHEGISYERSRGTNLTLIYFF